MFRLAETMFCVLLAISTVTVNAGSGATVEQIDHYYRTAMYTYRTYSWEAMSMYDMTLDNAIVMCRTMGFKNFNSTYKPKFGSQHEIGGAQLTYGSLQQVPHCLGTENHIDECPLMQSKCRPNRGLPCWMAGVNCKPEETFPKLSLWAMNYAKPRDDTYGTLRTSDYGSFDGMICNSRADGWGVNESRVACRQLGYGSDDYEPIPVPDASTKFTLPNWRTFVANDVRCKGTEDHLLACNFEDMCTYSGGFHCSDTCDGTIVGVICKKKTSSASASSSG